MLDPFLGNGSVNTFPRQRLLMQRGKRGVAYAVRAEELKRRELGPPSSVDSWQAVLYRNLEGRT
jgi:hypothetical protein